MTNPNTTIVLTADDQTAQALQAFVANMRAAQSQANSLGQGLGQATAPMQQLGASAAQTAAAMRMVPAQVTDIVVSLQAGQKPLTVLMQQGGQLKDMFGGVGNATKALGTYIGGLLTPTNLAVAAVAGLGLAYYQGSQEASAFQKAITLSGNAAGVTAGQMQDMARGLAVMQGTQSAASAALIEMASTGRVAGESLQTYTRSALDMERAVGTSVAETAKAFAQLGEAPLQASLKLNESTNYLTVALYKQIKALEDQGRATEAAKVAQDAYAAMTEQRAQSILQNLGYVERAWLGIKDAAKMAGDVIMDLGRSTTPTDQLASINARINEAMRGNGLKNASLSQAIRGMFDDTVVSKEILPALQAQAAAVAATTYAQEQNSKALAEGNERLKARAAFDQEQTKFLSNELKMRQEIAKVQAQYQAADGEISAKERDALIQNIRDKYKEKTSTAAGAGENEVARIRALIKEEETLTARIKERGIEGTKLSDSEKLVARIQEDLKTSISGVARANKEAALVEAQRYVQVQASRVAQEKQAQAVADSQKAYDALVADTRKAAAAIGQQASELEAANAVWGKGKTAIEEFRLEQMKLKLQEADSSDSFRPDYVAELRAQVAEQERLLTASRVKDYKTLAQAQEEYTRKVEEEALLYTDEVGLLGQTTREREKIVAVRKVELELAKQLAAIDRSGASAEDKARLVDQAQAAAAIARSTALAKSELNTLTDIINSVDHTAQSVWTNVFQGGQSAFEKIGATIKASVLDMLYQLTIRRWVVSITANVLGGLGGLGSLGGGGSNGLLNLAGSASNLYGGAGLIGSGVGALFGTTAGNAAMGVSMGLGTGSSTAAAVAAAQAGGMGAGAAGAAGLGASIGSAIPYVGMALAAYSLLSSMNGGETRSGGQYGVAYDGQVKNNRRDEVYTYEGQQYNRDNSLRPDGTRKSVTNGQAYLLEADGMGDREDATRKAVSSTAESINAMLKGLGSKAYLTDYHAGLETSGNGRGGVFAGGSLNTGAAFGESGKGSNYSGTLYETSSTRSPDMATAVANFTLDLKQSTIQALQAAQDIPQSIAAKLKDIDAEKLSDDEATQLITEINSQIASVEALRTLAGALPLKSLKDLSFDAADGLINLAGGIEALNQKISGYYENFYTQDERNAQTLGNVSAALQSVGLSTPKTREAFRALVEAQDLSTESGRKAYATLMNVADAFASITPSAEDLAKAAQSKADADKAQAAADKAKAEAEAETRKKTLQAATDAAYASLERAVAAEKNRLQAAKQVAQESVNTLGSLFNTLKGHVTELYSAVAATQAQSARAGLQFIDQALGTARSTGYLPDSTSLSDAITAARSGLDSSQFGSAFEQQRAQLTLAGKLAELKDLTGVQKSVAEQQLATAEDQLASLDKILSNAKDQVDALRGIDTSVLSVGQALEKIAGALLGEQEGSASATKPGVQVTNPGAQFTVGGGGSGGGSGGASSGTSSGGFTVGGGGNGGSGTTPTTKYSREVNLGAGAFTVGVTDPTEISRLDSLATLAQQFTGTGNVKGLLEATQASGATLSDLATVAGFRYEDLLKAAESVGVPRFAVGTNYVPQDMLALIHEGEAIVPKAYNPAAHALPQASSASSELLTRLIAEVQALRAQTAQLEAQARRTADATNGNPEGGAVPMALVEDHTQ